MDILGAMMSNHPTTSPMQMDLTETYVDHIESIVEIIEIIYAKCNNHLFSTTGDDFFKVFVGELREELENLIEEANALSIVADIFGGFHYTPQIYDAMELIHEYIHLELNKIDTMVDYLLYEEETTTQTECSCAVGGVCSNCLCTG
jgi:hypothetical protein